MMRNTKKKGGTRGRNKGGAAQDEMDNRKKRDRERKGARGEITEKRETQSIYPPLLLSSLSADSHF